MLPPPPPPFGPSFEFEGEFEEDFPMMKDHEGRPRGQGHGPMRGPH